MTTTSELIDRCRTDLGLLPDLIAWAHADGYNRTNAPTERPVSPGGSGFGPSDEEAKPEARPRCPVCRSHDIKITDAGRGPDGRWLMRSTCVANISTDAYGRPVICGRSWLSPDTRDHVPSRDTLDLGSPTSRHAYTTAIAHINAAELSIATAWTFTTGRRPALMKPLASHQPGRAITACHNTRRRLDDLLLPQYPYATRILIGRAANNLNTAWTTLNGAFTIGAADPNTQARAQGELCRICGIRDRETGCGGRCYTCKTYRTRRGHERPTHLDGIHEAIEAQERRAARGEGHGEG